MKELKINEEFKNLIPPLTQEEYRQLEENLIKEGCRDSLVTWNETIIDGHNRYRICTEHNIEFNITEMSFDTEDDVIEWMIRNQLGRRNLTDFQRNEVALKYQDIISEKMKERQREGQNKGRESRYSGLRPNGHNPEPTNQRKEMAKIAGTSEGSIQRSKLIIEKGTEEQIERARKGGSGNSVSAIYKEIVNSEKKDSNSNSEQQETKICKDCGRELPVSEFHEYRNDCKRCFSEKRQKTKDFKGNVLKISDELRNLSEEEVIGDLYNTEKVIEYNIKFLDEELASVVDYFIRNSNMCLDMHPELLQNEENIKKIMATMSRAEEAIKKIKGRYENEK